MHSTRWLALLVVLCGAALFWFLGEPNSAAPEAGRRVGVVSERASVEVGESGRVEPLVEPGLANEREVVAGDLGTVVVAEARLGFEVELKGGSRYTTPVEVRVRERRGESWGDPEVTSFDWRGDDSTVTVRSGVDLLVTYTPLPDESYRSLEPLEFDVEALAPGEQRVVSLKLEQSDPALFEGRVVERVSGAPLAGVRLVLVRRALLEGAYAKAPAVAVSDARGRFAIDLPASYFGGLHAALAEGWSTTLFNAVSGHEDEAHVAEVTMIRSARLRLTLEGIEALDHPMVRITTPAHYLRVGAPTRYSRYSGEDPFWPIDFDASNRAEVELPGEATFELEFEAGDVMRTFPELVTLEAGETRELFWSIDPGARVHGRLLDSSGAVIADTEVWLVRAKDAAPGVDYINGMNAAGAEQRVRTDAAGGFSFEHVAAGRVRVGPWAQAKSFAQRGEAIGPDEFCRIAVPVVISEGARDVEVDVVVQRGLTIKGRVVGPDGEPAPGCYVWVTPEGGRRSLSTQADGRGLFELGPLTAGPHTLAGFPVFGNLLPVTPRLVEAGTEDLEIVLRAGGTVSGSIIDAETGEKVKGLAVLARDGWSTSSGTSPQRLGEFERKQLEAGTYTIYATTRDGKVAPLESFELGPGEQREGFELYVVPGASLEIHYEGASERATYSVTVDSLPVLSWWLLNGDEETALLPPGHAVVEMRTGDGLSATFEVELVVGQRQRLEFELYPAESDGSRRK